MRQRRLLRSEEIRISGLSNVLREINLCSPKLGKGHDLKN